MKILKPSSYKLAPLREEGTVCAFEELLHDIRIQNRSASKSFPSGIHFGGFRAFIFALGEAFMRALPPLLDEGRSPTVSVA